MDTSLPSLPAWTEPFSPDITKPLSATPEVLQHVLGLRPWSAAQEFVALVQLTEAGARLAVQPARAGQFGSVEFDVSQETVQFVREKFSLDDETLCLTLGRFAALMAPMYGHQLVALARMYERAFMTTVRRAVQAVEDSARLDVYCEPDTGRLYFEGRWHAGVPAVAEELNCSRWVLNERMRTHSFTLAQAVADIRANGVAAPRVAQPTEVGGKVYPSVRGAMRSLGYRGTWELPKLVAKGTLKLLDR